MKNLIMILAFLAFGMIAFAQNTWTTTHTVVAPGYTYFWGAAHDTVQTTNIFLHNIMRIKSEKPVDIGLQLIFTKVSGTITGTKVTIYGSHDGTTYTPVDSITTSGDATNVQFKGLDDVNYPYLRFRAIGAGSSGTTRLKCWYRIVEE